MTGPAACAEDRFAVPVECCWTTFSPTRSVLLRTVPAFCAPPIGSSSDRRAATLPKGSVRARARKYRLSCDKANPGSCGLHDGQHGRGPPEVEQSAAVGGHVLMVAGARAEEVAQFIVCATEPGG